MRFDGSETPGNWAPSEVAFTSGAADAERLDEHPTERLPIPTAQAPVPRRNRHSPGMARAHGSGRRAGRTRIALAGALALVLVVGLAYGAVRYFTRTPNVEVYVVKNQSLSTHISGGGLTYPAQALNILYPVSATVETVNVHVGQAVQSGQTLLTLNSAALTSQLQQAFAAYQAAQNYLASLYASGATAALIAQAQSQVTTAKGRYDALNAELNSPTYRNGAVIAPFAGVISAVNAVPGATIRANATLLTLQDESNLIVRVQLSLKERALAQVGQRAEIQPDATPNVSAVGFVTVINPTLTKVGSDTFEVWITFANPGLLLLVGESVYARIAVNETLPAVPTGAVVHPNSNATVFVYSHGRAHMRPVNVGARSPDQLGVSNGLALHEEVILVGTHHLRDNEAVHVTRVHD